MRFLFLALTLSASSVLAQTSALQITIPNQPSDATLTLGGPALECEVPRTFNWSLTSTAGICGNLRIWLARGTSCDEEPGTLDRIILELTAAEQSQGSGSGTFTVSQLPGLGGDAGTVCGEAGQSIDYRICGSTSLTNQVLQCAVVKASPVEVLYDTEAPPAPSVEVTGLDSALSVRVNEEGGEPALFRVVVLRDEQQVAEKEQSLGNSLFRMEGLENGVTYSVQAFSIDEAGNESAASEPAQGTPVKTFGFIDRYTEANGAEQGGCNATGGGLVAGAVLAVLGFWLSSRRNRS